jgi:hypothetical protein
MKRRKQREVEPQGDKTTQGQLSGRRSRRPEFTPLPNTNNMPSSDAGTSSLSEKRKIPSLV